MTSKQNLKSPKGIDVSLNLSAADIAVLSVQPGAMNTEDYLLFLKSITPGFREDLSRRVGPHGEKFQLPE